MRNDDHLKELLDEVAERAAHRDNLAYALTGEHRWEWRRFTDAAGCEDTLVEWMGEDPQWPMFARELMAVLQHAGNVEPLEHPLLWAAWCHGIAEELPEFPVLLDLCAGKRWDAGAAAMALAKAVLREWQNRPPMPEPEPQPEPEAGEGGGGDGDQCEQPVTPSPDTEPPESSQGDAAEPPPPGEGQPENDEQEPEQEPEEVDQPPPPPGNRVPPREGALRTALRDAVRSAIATSQESQEALAALTHGLTGSGICQVPPEERERLAQKLALDPQLRQVLLEMGRLLRVATAKRRSDVLGAPAEITSVVTGQDIARTVASELAMLGNAATRIEFCRRFLERQTLVYQTKGRDTARGGPVVVCLDVSGSMSGWSMTHAAATALALCHNALRDDRAAVVLPFDTRVHDAIVFSRQTAIEATTRVASLGAHGGGTRWSVALDEARRLIEDDQSSGGTWHRADVVMITDGACTVSEGWADGFRGFKDRVGVTVYAMLIASGWMSVDEATRELYAFSDVIHTVGDQEDGNKAAGIVAAVKKGGGV